MSAASFDAIPVFTTAFCDTPSSPYSATDPASTVPANFRMSARSVAGSLQFCYNALGVLIKCSDPCLLSVYNFDSAFANSND